MLTFTVAGMPLIYNGQEARLDRRLSFFDRDPITWRDDPMAELYRTLAQLKRDNRALWHGGAGGRVEVIEKLTNDPVLTFERKAAGNRVVVVMLNLGANVQYMPAPEGTGNLRTVLGTAALDGDGKMVLQPWSYHVWASAPERQNNP